MYSILKPDYVYRDISEDIADHDDDYDAEEWNYNGRDVYRGSLDNSSEWNVYWLYDDVKRVGLAEHDPENPEIFHALWFRDNAFSTLFQEDWKTKNATIWSILSNEAYQDCLEDDFKTIFEASDGSFDSFFSGLSEKAGQAAQFANDLKNELIQQLSPEAMQEVIDAGPVTGDAIIQGLIAGGKDAIDKTNDLVASTQAAAVKAGESSKEHWKGAGVTNAFQQVKGMLGKLQEMTPQIMDVMDEIALKMRRHVVIDVTVSQSAFNVDVYVTRHITEVVDSVTRAVHAAGGWVMGSGTVPILAHAGEFVISNAMLAGRSEMPDSVKAAVGSGGSTTSNNITVNASTNADAYEISHEIAWALKVGV
jgi:hypothetical protein